MVITCRASTKHPEMPQNVLLLKKHISNRNTSSQPFMTPCAWQVMNRIPGNVTPPWAGCWGPSRSYSMSGAIYLPAQKTTNSKADPPDQNPPTAPRRVNPWGRRENPLPAIRINSLEVHRGSPHPDQRSACRENISVVTRGDRWEVAGLDFRG